MCISRDPKSGGKNTSIYRLQLKGRNRLGIMAQHLVRQLVEAESMGKGLPIAIAIGTDPVLPLATQWMAPYGTDELALAGSLRGAPVEVVKAETVDLEVPATAEIIIEGTVLPNVREEEGPFGEVSGYYTPSNPEAGDRSDAQSRIVEIRSIRPRSPACRPRRITFSSSCRSRRRYYWQLKKEFPGVTAVHFPAAGTVGMTCVIAMKQAYECEARNLIAAMIGTRRNKITVVVDDDVDITDMEKVWWAITTRTQADEDVIVFPRVVATAMDPSVRKVARRLESWHRRHRALRPALSGNRQGAGRGQSIAG